MISQVVILKFTIGPYIYNIYISMGDLVSQLDLSVDEVHGMIDEADLIRRGVVGRSWPA